MLADSVAGRGAPIQMGGGRRCTLIRAASELGVHRGSGDVDAGVVDGVTDDIHHDRHMPLQVTSHYSVRPLSHFTGLCLVSSITFPFIRIRFRNRFRNPRPHCVSVAPFPFPYRVPNGNGKIELDPIWTDEWKRNAGNQA